MTPQCCIPGLRLPRVHTADSISLQYRGRGVVRTERLLPWQGAPKRKQKKGGGDSGCGSGLAPWLGCCLSVHCGLCTFSRHNILQQNRENPAQGMKARRRLRALSALLEDRGSILSSYLAALPSVNPVLGDSVPSSGLQGTRHTNGVQTYL